MITQQYLFELSTNSRLILVLVLVLTLVLVLMLVLPTTTLLQFGKAFSQLRPRRRLACPLCLFKHRACVLNLFYRSGRRRWRQTPWSGGMHRLGGNADPPHIGEEL
jgi:hypothetical protein